MGLLIKATHVHLSHRVIHHNIHDHLHPNRHLAPTQDLYRWSLGIFKSRIQSAFIVGRKGILKGIATNLSVISSNQAIIMGQKTD